MLAEKLLDKLCRVKLSDAAYEQFIIAGKEVKKLSNLSPCNWGTICDDYHDMAILLTLGEGIVYGLLLNLGIRKAKKIIENIKK